MSEERLNTFIKQSAAFIESIHAHVANLEPAQHARPQAAFQAGLLAIEHGTAAHALIAQNFLASAYALMRPQYECLVRGVWLIHAASETWVGKFTEPLTSQSAKRANEGPMLAEMLQELDAAPGSPRLLIAQLKQYRDVAWKAMNSYTHGGIHPLSRLLTGYPPELTYGVIRNSNAILALSTQLVSIATGDPNTMAPVRQLHRDFAACLPSLPPGSQ